MMKINYIFCDAVRYFMQQRLVLWSKYRHILLLLLESRVRLSLLILGMDAKDENDLQLNRGL